MRSGRTLYVFLSVCLSVSGLETPTSYQPILHLSTYLDFLCHKQGYKVGWKIRSKLQKFFRVRENSLGNKQKWSESSFESVCL